MFLLVEPAWLVEVLLYIDCIEHDIHYWLWHRLSLDSFQDQQEVDPVFAAVVDVVAAAVAAADVVAIVEVAFEIGSRISTDRNCSVRCCYCYFHSIDCCYCCRYCCSYSPVDNCCPMNVSNWNRSSYFANHCYWNSNSFHCDSHRRDSTSHCCFFIEKKDHWSVLKNNREKLSLPIVGIVVVIVMIIIGIIVLIVLPWKTF